MNLTQVVHHIVVDRPTGSLFVQHCEGQISTNSDAMVQLKYSVIPGYVQVCSCEDIWDDDSNEYVSIRVLVEALVKIHNSTVLSR